MAGRVQDRVALVTGAAQGIGAAIARRLHAEGALVIASDIDGARVAEQAAFAADIIELDVSSEGDWQRTIARVGERFGQLDVLVNNAGVEDVQPVRDMSLADWRRVMAVNLDGVFLGCKTALPLLEAAGARGCHGSVINVSSIAGIVGYANQAAYNSSKAGVRHLTKSLAIEWSQARLPIRVNSVHPGCIRTPMLEQAVAGWVERGLLPAADPWPAVAAMCPMNLIGAPDDIAAGVLYLASDEARFVTGSELVIDGGWIAQ